MEEPAGAGVWPTRPQLYHDQQVVRKPEAACALTYVPSDATDVAARRHRPAQARAGPRRALDLPVHDLLRRTHAQRRQRELALAEGAAGVSVGRSLPFGKSPRLVCLVDDVYTSGATADACAAALRKAGASRVEVVMAGEAVG